MKDYHVNIIAGNMWIIAAQFKDGSSGLVMLICGIVFCALALGGILKGGK